MIERARADADQRFARAGDRIGGVFVAEDVGSSVGVEPDGLHRLPEQGKAALQRLTRTQKSVVNTWCGPKAQARQ